MKIQYWTLRGMLDSKSECSKRVRELVLADQSKFWSVVTKKYTSLHENYIHSSSMRPLGRVIHETDQPLFDVSDDIIKDLECTVPHSSSCLLVNHRFDFFSFSWGQNWSWYEHDLVRVLEVTQRVLFLEEAGKSNQHKEQVFYACLL